MASDARQKNAAPKAALDRGTLALQPVRYAAASEAFDAAVKIAFLSSLSPPERRHILPARTGTGIRLTEDEVARIEATYAEAFAG